MRNFFLILLTTLFVNAMPLQAAYAQADDGKSQDCSVSYQASIVDADVEALVKAKGGTYTEIEGVRAKAFQERVEEALGSKAPFSSDKIVLVNPDGEVDTLVNIGFFVNDCLKAMMTIPQEVVEKFLSPFEKKPGERVD